MIFLMLGISSSYYSGWKNGYDWLHQNSLSYECLRDPASDLKCRNIFSVESQYENLKILKELELSVFSEKINVPVDPLLNNEKWRNMILVEEGFGEIEYINNNPFESAFYIPSESKIFVERTESPIDIGGWGIFSKKDKEVDSVYVFVDNHVNSKAHYGYMNLNYEIYGEKTEPSFFAGIGGVILPKELSEGCHTISLRIVDGFDYYEIFTESQICLK